jgi:hypothetical protein
MCTLLTGSGWKIHNLASTVEKELAVVGVHIADGQSPADPQPD